MKRILFLLAALVIAAPTAHAVEATMQTHVITLTGYVIDNSCARTNMKNLAEVCLTYTSECALKAECIKSGYTFYTSEGKLTPFNKASNKKVEEFLKKPDSKTLVTIKAEVVREKLNLISIENLSEDNKANSK